MNRNGIAFAIRFRQVSGFTALLLMATLWGRTSSAADTRGLRLAGRTVDSNGEIVAGASIQVSLLSDGKAVHASNATSDRNGNFRCELPNATEDVNTAKVAMSAHAPNRALVRQLLNASEIDSQVVMMELPAAQSLVLFVHDKEGNPIAGAVLKMVATDAHYTKLQYFPDELVRGLCLRVPTSDEDGMIRIRWLPVAGHGSFRLQHDDSASIYVDHPSLAARPPSHRASLSSRLKRVRQFQFQLCRKGRIHGRVIDSSTGQGAAGVSINVVDPMHQTVIARAVSDNAGVYSIQCAAIECQVAIDSHSDFEATDEPRNVDVIADSDTEVSQLTVTPRSPIRGQVLGADGEPAAGVLVGHHWKGQLTTTDEAGRFEVARGLFSRREEVITAVGLDQGEIGIATATDASEHVEVQLQPASSASGVVLDGSNMPVAHAVIEWSMTVRVGPTRRIRYRQGNVYSSSDGSFQLVGLIPGVEFFATVSKERRRNASARFRAEDRPTTIQPLIFQEADRITETGSPTQYKLITSDMPLPDLACQTWHHSDPLSLRDLRGKIVLLNFWGTWCGPCKRELPLLKMLHERHADDGLVVIEVHTATFHDPEQLEKDIQQYELSYAIAVDEPAQTTVAAYGVRSYPTTLLIDRDGKLQGRMRRRRGDRSEN